MPDKTLAQELRDTAKSMRMIAGHCDAGPWDSRNLGRHDRAAVVTRAIGAPILIGSFEGARGAANGVHAGKWDPDVALAVAELLEAEAESAELLADGVMVRRAPIRAALKVARAYMGTREAPGELPTVVFDPGRDLEMADWARQAVAWGSTGDELPTTTPTVISAFQAVCGLPRCNWVSGCHPGEQEITEDAARHLARHRAALAWARGETPSA